MSFGFGSDAGLDFRVPKRPGVPVAEKERSVSWINWDIKIYFRKLNRLLFLSTFKQFITVHHNYWSCRASNRHAHKVCFVGLCAPKERGWLRVDVCVGWVGCVQMTETKKDKLKINIFLQAYNWKNAPKVPKNTNYANIHRERRGKAPLLPNGRNSKIINKYQ